MHRTLRLVFAGLLLTTSATLAHKPSDAYLTLRIANAQVSGEWHLALRDLEYAVGLDSNEDGAITWQELRSHEPMVTAYALSRLQITNAASVGRVRVTQL